MKSKYRYYVHEDEGKITRIARLGGGDDDFGAYGWENGEWVIMNGLWKIENDVTADYRQISEEEALKLTK